jgi:hypothetical protein
MQQIICDFCKKDITDEEIFNLTIFNQDRDREEQEEDVCFRCLKRIRKALKDIKKVKI